MSRQSQARIGIIGCGSFGGFHAQVFSRIRRAKLVGFYNRTLERAENMCKQYGGELATDNIDRLLELPQLDGVIIATTHNSHKDLAIKAAQAGKHILIEKPLAMNLRECMEIERAAGDNASKITVGHKYRLAPTVQRARELLNHPVLIIGQFTEDIWPDHWWQLDPVRGGGSVLGNGVHALDLMCYLAQSRPIRVYAEGATFSHPGHPCLDHMVGTIVFQNGSLGSWIQGQSGLPVRASKYQFSLFGAQNVAIEIHNRLMNGIYRIGERTEEIKYSGDEALHQQALSFVAQICDDTAPMCPLRWEGVLPNLLLEACYRASETRVAQEIRWEQDRPILANGSNNKE